MSFGDDLNDVIHDLNRGLIVDRVCRASGRTPSAELINRANGIRRQWIDYWAITT